MLLKEESDFVDKSILSDDENFLLGVEAFDELDLDGGDESLEEVDKVGEDTLFEAVVAILVEGIDLLEEDAAFADEGASLEEVDDLLGTEVVLVGEPIFARDEAEETPLDVCLAAAELEEGCLFDDEEVTPEGCLFDDEEVTPERCAVLGTGRWVVFVGKSGAMVGEAGFKDNK